MAAEPEKRLVARLLIGAIKLYQWALSPLTAPRCRYHPSCSSYAAEAIDRYGARRGAWIAVKRLARCHPFGGSGYDPVPDLAVADSRRSAGEY